MVLGGGGSPGGGPPPPRDSVMQSLNRDPKGRGWRRQTTGKSCAFCVMLAGRGAVYSAATVRFKSHDYCDCIAVPVFQG
jgi:hypothetical protein